MILHVRLEDGTKEQYSLDGVDISKMTHKDLADAIWDILGLKARVILYAVK